MILQSKKKQPIEKKKLKNKESTAYSGKNNKLDWLKEFSIGKDKNGQDINPKNKLEIKSDDYAKHVLSKIGTYFHIKKSMLHYLFPYQIEYGKMQSKFSTTRYISNFNISIPFKLEYYKLIYKKMNITSFSLKKNEKEKYLLSLTKKLKKKRRENVFQNYKIFYIKLKDKLKEQKEKHRILAEKKKKLVTINQEMIYHYNKFHYFKFPRYIWVMIFEDPIIEKFTNLLIKDGKKEKSEKIIMKMFLHLHGHMRRDPFFIIKKSIQCVRPYIRSKVIPFGRRTKTVPHPISEKQQIKLAMKWIKEEVLNNKAKEPLHFKLIETLNHSSFRKGESYHKMINMHKEAYSQRAYMYFNYFLKSSKARNKRHY
uniref:Ribosomal protein S7 n=1 Tax=Pharyngomonas kirbyi TaxID=63601 RepID=A0A1W6R290_9EUKA|nr:ribosomal protein S7 [Pharyngomonas kirbyi]ARO48007.1 ribosomal protein S7 [Pharyngomonas kirbyi]